MVLDAASLGAQQWEICGKAAGLVAAVSAYEVTGFGVYTPCPCQHFTKWLLVVIGVKHCSVGYKLQAYLYIIFDSCFTACFPLSHTTIILREGKTIALGVNLQLQSRWTYRRMAVLSTKLWELRVRQHKNTWMVIRQAPLPLPNIDYAPHGSCTVQFFQIDRCEGRVNLDVNFTNVCMLFLLWFSTSEVLPGACGW